MEGLSEKGKGGDDAVLTKTGDKVQEETLGQTIYPIVLQEKQSRKTTQGEK